MAYDTALSERIRRYLHDQPNLVVTEKKMFRGLTFMVNDKMCVCASGDNLMCRFDPKIQDEISAKNGYLPMIMKGKVYKGYCYIQPEGIKSEKDFEFFVDLCLNYNKFAKSSKI